MPSTLKIAVVFATMNRAATAVSCVRALAAQTRPPEIVIVADNVSTDETVTTLNSLTNLPFELIIHRMRENRGNAGGVQEAMDLAFAKGADAVWILDDDSWPRVDALEHLASSPWDPTLVRIPLQIDPRSGRFTWPLQVREGKRDWSLAETSEDLPIGDRFPTRNNWTGALISRQVRDLVGPVPGELFIRGEDEAYPWQMKQQGVEQEAIIASILDHPGPTDIRLLKIGGYRLFFEPALADWKLYYKVRNMVWLKRRQSGAIKALAMAGAYALATAWIDGAQRLPLVWNAVRDGWRGRLGRWEKHGG